jgi:hypothetical protein
MIASRCCSFYARSGLLNILLAFLTLVHAANACAQASKVGAALDGTVSDSSGAVIPGARVTLRNNLTNVIRVTLTNEQGAFHAEELVVGTYEVRVNQPGFAPYRHSGVQLALGQTVHLDIVLVPPASSAEVTVNAQPAAIDPSQTSVASSVDRERIEELPLRSRNYLDFVLLAPGVSTAPVAPPERDIPAG